MVGKKPRCQSRIQREEMSSRNVSRMENVDLHDRPIVGLKTKIDSHHDKLDKLDKLDMSDKSE